MVGIAAEAVGTIKTTLEEMEEMAKQVKEGDLTYSASVADEYNALRDKIIGIVESTLYNGIALMDSSEWGTEQIDSNGNVHIQSTLSSDPNLGGFDVTFRALDTIPWSTQLSGTDLANEISEMISTQRGYQANTRVVTVTDAMLEELVNMKR